MKLQQQYQQLITVFSSKSLLQFSANIGRLFGEAKFSYFGNPFRGVSTSCNYPVTFATYKIPTAGAVQSVSFHHSKTPPFSTFHSNLHPAIIPKY